MPPISEKNDSNQIPIQTLAVCLNSPGDAAPLPSLRRRGRQPQQRAFLDLSNLLPPAPQAGPRARISLSLSRRPPSYCRASPRIYIITSRCRAPGSAASPLQLRAPLNPILLRLQLSVREGSEVSDGTHHARAHGGGESVQQGRKVSSRHARQLQAARVVFERQQGCRKGNECELNWMGLGITSTMAREGS